MKEKARTVQEERYMQRLHAMRSQATGMRWLLYVAGRTVPPIGAQKRQTVADTFFWRSYLT